MRRRPRYTALQMALDGFAVLCALLCRHNGPQEGRWLAEYGVSVFRCAKCGRVVMRAVKAEGKP